MGEDIYQTKLTPDMIKRLIDEYNKEIKDLLNPNIFLLNNDIKDILEKIKELQSACPHEFENGYCNHCYLSEKDYKESKNG